MKILFIGNSATYVNDIPSMLCRLSTEAGYSLEACMITRGGAYLCEHAHASSDHGRSVYSEIERGYDIVFLQEHSGCIATEQRRAQTSEATAMLDEAIRRSGAATFIYVRPPSGKPTAGIAPYEQCIEYDGLFGDIAARLGARCAYVNRAFAYAIERKLDIPLWGADNAHTSREGAYLAVCVFFSSIFGISSGILGRDTLPEAVAASLQRAADAVVFDRYIPRKSCNKDVS